MDTDTVAAITLTSTDIPLTGTDMVSDIMVRRHDAWRNFDREENAFNVDEYFVPVLTLDSLPYCAKFNFLG